MTRDEGLEDPSEFPASELTPFQRGFGDEATALIGGDEAGAVNPFAAETEAYADWELGAHRARELVERTRARMEWAADARH